MKQKKILAATLALALAAGSMTACSSGSASGKKETFKIWANGSDNVKTQFEQQIAQFNKTSDKYEAQLNFITSGTGAQGLSDRLIAAVKAGQKNTDYDLVENSDSDMVTYVSQCGEDVFEKIDRSGMKNIGNLKFESSVEKDRIVPYRGTCVLLAYNSDMVSNPPKTTQELYAWIKANPGKFAYNTPDSGGAGGSFVTTSVYNPLDKSALTSTDKANEQKWDQGFSLLKELHPYLYKSSGKVVYPNKNQGTLDLLANKEIAMCPAWADMVISQKTQGTMPASIQLVQLDPAFTGNLVGFSIPTIGSHSKAATAFIDYMLSPEAQNIALKSMAALPVIDYSKLDADAVKSISTLNITSFRMSSIGKLSADLNDRWKKDIATLS